MSEEAPRMTFGMGALIQIGGIVAMGAIVWTQTADLRSESSRQRSDVSNLQSLASSHTALIEGLEREVGYLRGRGDSLLDRVAKNEGALSCRLGDKP